jgi:glutamine amidotransferase
MIAIVDYGAGNLRPIKRALEAAGAGARITDDPASVRDAERVVLPGVGNAGASMRRLQETGLADAITEIARRGTPLLGVCLGMQLLFGHQEEGETVGLGLLAGRVRLLPSTLKVPHMGWNNARLGHNSPLGGAGENREFYFVHSYYADPDDPADVAAWTDYGISFPSIVIHDNIWGAQFHPEKSGPDGLALVRQWATAPAITTGAAR